MPFAGSHILTVLSLLPRPVNAIIEAYYGRRMLGVNTSADLTLSINKTNERLQQDLEQQQQQAAQGQVVGSASVTEITVGAQAGGMSCSEILFFKDKAAMDQFKEGRLEFSANAAAVVVKNGAAAAASYDNGVAVFVMGLKGAMVDASIGGQKFTFHAK